MVCATYVLIVDNRGILANSTYVLYDRFYNTSFRIGKGTATDVVRVL